MWNPAHVVPRIPAGRCRAPLPPTGTGPRPQLTAPHRVCPTGQRVRLFVYCDSTRVVDMTRSTSGTGTCPDKHESFSANIDPTAREDRDSAVQSRHPVAGVKVSESQTEQAPLRRRPVQQRSARRVERMLDAASDLLNEHGYEALTTTAIAKRAGVAVGSLYQFFPDKRAVVQALTQRNLERFMAEVSMRLPGGDRQHWWDLVDALLDIYLRMHREVPGFARVHFGDVVDRRLLDE